MFKVVALAAALSACAHPRSALVSGAGMAGLGLLALSANQMTSCSSTEAFGCFGAGLGDDIANGVAHTTGAVLLTTGLVVVGAGLVGLSNENQPEHHKI
jgi:hypothetical protein